MSYHLKLVDGFKKQTAEKQNRFDSGGVRLGQIQKHSLNHVGDNGTGRDRIFTFP